MKYSTVEGMCYNANSKEKEIEGYVTFTEDSFLKPYSWAERTYVFSSNNKAFNPKMNSTSCWACSEDGSDNNVDIDAYMRGKDGWEVEDSGIVQYQLVVHNDDSMNHTVLGVFPTYKTAKEKMRDEISSIGISFDADLDAYMKDHPEAHLGKYNAFIEKYGVNYTWTIFRIFTDEYGIKAITIPEDDVHFFREDN